MTSTDRMLSQLRLEIRTYRRFEIRDNNKYMAGIYPNAASGTVRPVGKVRALITCSSTHCIAVCSQFTIVIHYTCNM